MREELERRPLVAAFIGLVIGTAGFVSIYNLLFVVPLLFVLRTITIRITLIACCLLGWVIYPRLETRMVVEEGFLSGDVDVVTMPVLTGERRSCVVEHGRARYVLYGSQESGFVLGDRLSVRADVLPLREGQAAPRGAIGILQCLRDPVVTEQGSPLWRAGLWVSQSFRDMTSQFALPVSGAMLDAMCFNMTSEVPDELNDAMVKSGTLHIVSTSGLHLVLVALALASVLGRMPVARSVMLVLLFVLLMIYAGAAGFRPPIVRAIAMAAVFMSAYLWRRGPDGLSSLALAGSLSLLAAPEVVGDVGFQLSMAAVASLVLFAQFQIPDEAHPFARVGLQYAWASVVVTLGTAPLVAYHFGQFSIVAVIGNLLVLPVLSIVIGGALGAWLTWLVTPLYGIAALKLLVEPLTGWVAAAIQVVGGLPFAVVTVPEFSPYWIVALYAVAVLVWRPVVRSP